MKLDTRHEKKALTYFTDAFFMVSEGDDLDDGEEGKEYWIWHYRRLMGLLSEEEEQKNPWMNYRYPLYPDSDQH